MEWMGAYCAPRSNKICAIPTRDVGCRCVIPTTTQQHSFIKTFCYSSWRSRRSDPSQPPQPPPISCASIKMHTVYRIRHCIDMCTHMKTYAEEQQVDGSKLCRERIETLNRYSHSLSRLHKPYSTSHRSVRKEQRNENNNTKKINDVMTFGTRLYTVSVPRHTASQFKLVIVGWMLMYC